MTRFTSFKTTFWALHSLLQLDEDASTTSKSGRWRLRASHIHTAYGRYLELHLDLNSGGPVQNQESFLYLYSQILLMSYQVLNHLVFLLRNRITRYIENHPAMHMSRTQTIIPTHATVFFINTPSSGHTLPSGFRY